MFAIGRNNTGRYLLRGTQDELLLVSCLYDEVKILKVRTGRAALVLLHYPQFSDHNNAEVERTERVAWKCADQVEGLPNAVENVPRLCKKVSCTCQHLLEV